MRILLVTPAPARSRLGNRVTALRWRRILRELGHHAQIGELDGRPWDVVVALHARKSAHAAFAAKKRGIPTIVALTGTDLYRDVRESEEAREALRVADRLIVLQSQGLEELPLDVREKARVVHQSAVPARAKRRRPARTFDVSLVGHLREEKDPFRVVEALRLLPSTSHIRVLHAGRALDDALRTRAERERSARYRWLGELSPGRVRALIGSSHLMVLTSIIEGGANVLSEALVERTPVLSSRIPSSIGVLGPDFPGFFPVGDTRALAELLVRAERDAAFLRALLRAGDARRPLFLPARERRSWRALLAELV